PSTPLRNSPSPSLLLHRAADETADERALAEYEDDRDRDDREQRRERKLRLEDVDRLTAAADRRVERRRRREQVREADGDRILVRVGEDHVRQEEVVPVGDEAEEEDECEHRLREREGDAQECLQLGRPVDPRCVEEVGRERRHVVDVGEADAEREERDRQDHRQRASDQVHAVELEEDGEDERCGRHDHHEQRQREHELPPRELPDGEAVPGGHADGERDRGRAERVVEGVADPAPVDVVAERVQVLPRERHLVEAAERERMARDESLVALRRREDEPEHGRDEEDGERQEDREPGAEAERAEPHQSSVLKSPLRVTIRTAPTSPIASRSTAIAAAPLKSAYRNASWYASWFADHVSGTRPKLACCTISGSTKSCVPVANDRITMYAIHLRISGSFSRSAIVIGPAPSMRAASSRSCGIVFRAPYMTTIQPPAPVQKAIMAKTNGRFPGAIDCAKMFAPSTWCSRNEPGLTVGSSMKSQTRTEAAPASAPGM